jgi:hypothetical protein
LSTESYKTTGELHGGEGCRIGTLTGGDENARLQPLFRQQPSSVGILASKLLTVGKPKDGVPY